MENLTTQVEDRNKIRGYLFNVIIYAHEKHRAEYLKHLVSTFIENYPCRVIFIQSEKEAGQDYLETDPIKEKAFNGTCDKVSISTSMSKLHQVPFEVLPLLIADLPIYLVWGQNPTSDNEILPTMQKLATRFVYDSDCASDLQEFSAKMLENISQLKIDFMDVGWANISGWRDVIAQTFNSRSKLQYLNNCDKITICYNNIEDPLTSHPSRQALYLQAWLAAQLEWTYQSSSIRDNEMTIQYKTPDAVCKIILQQKERSRLSQGRIFEMEFHDINEVSTTLSLAEKQEKVLIYRSTAKKCELPYSFSIPDMEKGLNAMKEIFYNRVSEHYKNMLEILKQTSCKGM